jgi:4-hydroxyphenylpyruvate dioxygenase
MQAVCNEAVRNGAATVSSPKVLRDVDGEVMVVSVKTYSDTTRTLVERRRYRGAFLPGFHPARRVNNQTFLLEVLLEAIDHCAGNQDWGEMEDVCD